MSSTRIFLALSSTIFSVSALNKWQQYVYTDCTIKEREGQAGAYVSQTKEYLVFGGMVLNPDAYLNDLYSINLSTLKCVQLFANAPLNSRGYSGYAFDSKKSFLYIHSGWTGGGNLSYQTGIIIFL